MASLSPNDANGQALKGENTGAAGRRTRGHSAMVSGCEHAAWRRCWDAGGWSGSGMLSIGREWPVLRPCSTLGMAAAHPMSWSNSLSEGGPMVVLGWLDAGPNPGCHASAASLCRAHHTTSHRIPSDIPSDILPQLASYTGSCERQGG